VRLYPDILFTADKNKQNLGAYRIWFIAKDFCNGRANSVPVEAFRSYLRDLDVSRASYSRWIDSALKTGLFKLIQSKRKVYYYELASWQTGAYLAGCAKVSKPVEVDLKQFLGRKWKSYAWSALMSKYSDKPMARKTLETLTAVPERTQRYRDKSGRVKRDKNIALHGNVIDNPDLVQRAYSGYEYGFYVDDKANLYQRLPDAIVAPESVKSLGLGRTKKVNKALSSLFLRDAVELEVAINRRYSDSPKETKRIIRGLRKRSNLIGEVMIYERVKAPNSSKAYNYLAVAV